MNAPSPKFPPMQWLMMIGLGLALGGIMFLVRSTIPTQCANTPQSSGNGATAVDAGWVSLLESCEESGGALWGKAVRAELARGKSLHRCPPPPQRAKAVWDSQPEYSRHFDMCISAGRQTAQCVMEVRPFCAEGILDNSTLQRNLSLSVASPARANTSGWQIEDVELSTGTRTIHWKSRVWRVTKRGEATVVHACVVEGMFNPIVMAQSPSEAIPPIIFSDTPPGKVEVLAEFGPYSQWDCGGSLITLSNDEQASFLAGNGCTRKAEISQGKTIEIQLASHSVCQRTHSSLEWPKTTLSCEGNNLYVWLPSGKFLLRPNWWWSVVL